MSGAQPNVAQLAGPLVMGYVFNWALFGALSVQVYLYATSFPNDRHWMKCLVFGIFVFEMAQTFLFTHDMFASFVFGWGDLTQLESAHLAWVSAHIMGGIVSCVVQLFYAYRVYILSRSKFIGSGIAVLAVAQAACAVASGTQFALVGKFTELENATHVTTVMWFSGSALCDIVVAACMSYYLSRNNTVFRQTQVLINKLVRLAIETGALTATVATVDLVIFLALPNTNFHTTLTYSMGKLYSNSLLVMLNARTRSDHRVDHISCSDLSEMRPSKPQIRRSDVEGGLAPIRITTDLHQVADESQKAMGF